MKEDIEKKIRAKFKPKAARFKQIKNKQNKNTKTTEIGPKWWQMLKCKVFKLKKSPPWTFLTLEVLSPGLRGAADERALEAASAAPSPQPQPQETCLVGGAD